MRGIFSSRLGNHCWVSDVRILKIGQYLAKLWTRVECFVLVFFDSRGIFSSQQTAVAVCIQQRVHKSTLHFSPNQQYKLPVYNELAWCKAGWRRGTRNVTLSTLAANRHWCLRHSSSDTPNFALQWIWSAPLMNAHHWHRNGFEGRLLRLIGN